MFLLYYAKHFSSDGFAEGSGQRWMCLARTSKDRINLSFEFDPMTFWI
jgi:hypothetical protein